MRTFWPAWSSADASELTEEISSTIARTSPPSAIRVASDQRVSPGATVTSIKDVGAPTASVVPAPAFRPKTLVSSVHFRGSANGCQLCGHNHSWTNCERDGRVPFYRDPISRCDYRESISNYFNSPILFLPRLLFYKISWQADSHCWAGNIPNRNIEHRVDSEFN